MQHFYDGQIRRYLTQTIRVLSNFVVKYGDGTLVRVPVMYGDADRQVASIIRNNSENKINSVPRISVYISGLAIDRERLGDASFVSKVHIREREIDIANNMYNQAQGRNYTVERLMPTPFKLTMKCDIWSANTDQKLQILEQIMVLFNPSLELQTSDNYLDWTSLTVLNLNDVGWSTKSVPVGNDTPIDIATLTLDTPIWISPPVKVKHLGVITNIITSLWQNSDTGPSNYVEGLGVDTTGPTTTFSTLLSEKITTITDYNIQVYSGQAELLSRSENAIPREPTLEIPIRQGIPVNWEELFAQYPGKYVAGSSTIFLTQSNGTSVVGTVAINSLDSTMLNINWDPDTYPADDDIVTTGDREASNRSAGTFDAIIDPQKVYPNHGMTDIESGDRFLIIEDIGSDINVDGPDGWKNTDNTDFVARANDIIEWQDDHWQIIFEAAQEADTLLYQTNIYKGRADFRVQYMWNGVSWVKSFEGEYKAGSWRLEL